MDPDELTRKADELHQSIYGTPASDTDNLEPDTDDVNIPGDDNDDEPVVNLSDKELEELRQKYSALEGRYKAETERMSQLLSSAFFEKEQLANQLASTTTSTQAADPTEDELAELQSEYPSLYKGFNAMLEKKLAEKLKGTEEKIATVTNVADNIQKDNYLTRLDEVFPKWREIKDNPEFSKWLAVQDRYTELPRMQLLIDADSRKNYSVVSKIYEDFAKEAGLMDDDGAVATQTEHAPTHTATNVSPSTAGNPTPPLNQQKGFITRAEIGQIYKNRMKGQYSDEEFSKIEAKIFKMTREGKVR